MSSKGVNWVDDHLLDSKLRRLLLLVVDESIPLGVASQIGGHLAGEDVAKGGEGVVQGLVVNAFVKILNENVAHTGLAEGRVTVAPHDAHGLALAIIATFYEQQCQISPERENTRFGFGNLY